MPQQTITGYTYGTKEAAKSPITIEEFERLKETVLFTKDDERYLRMAGEVLADQIDDVLDLWYDFIGSHSALIYYFSGPNGKPDPEYLASVRKRFGQWILDTCNRPYDRDWLNYQHEIGLRHHRTKKNRTDNVESVPNIGYRYMVALIYPITTTIKSFLEKKGRSGEEVEKMYQAWFKSVVLQVTLWSYPYITKGDY